MEKLGYCIICRSLHREIESCFKGISEALYYRCGSAADAFAEKLLNTEDELTIHKQNCEIYKAVINNQSKKMETL